VVEDEPGVSDDRRDVAREVASAGKSTLQGFEAALPGDNLRVGSEAVL
jgi:hypothetical protein